MVMSDLHLNFECEVCGKIYKVMTFHEFTSYLQSFPTPLDNVSEPSQPLEYFKSPKHFRTNGMFAETFKQGQLS